MAISAPLSSSFMVSGADWFKARGDWMLHHEREGEAAKLLLDELVPRGPCRSNFLDDPEAFADLDAEWSMQQEQEEAAAAPFGDSVALHIDWRNPVRLAPQIPIGHPLYRPPYCHPQQQCRQEPQQETSCKQLRLVA